MRSIEEERDELMHEKKFLERKTEEMGSKLLDLEREVRALLQDREREVKDHVLRASLEQKVT